MDDRNKDLKIEELEMVADQLRCMLDDALEENRKLKVFRDQIINLIDSSDDSLPV